MGIRKRGKGWLVTVELGADERGVRRRKCVSCATETEAKRIEATLTAEVLSGSYVEPSTETLAEFLDEWLKHTCRGRRQRTIDQYRITVERHLKPALGRVKLAYLTPLQIERFLTEQRAKGLAQVTADKHFWTLHKALDRAVSWGKIARNPADRVEKPGQQDSHVRTFDIDEQARLIGRAAGTWLHGPILLALSTGMRRGEIVALTWRDVDLEAGIITVRSSLEESSRGVCMGAAKTDASVRRVRIPESLVAFLTDHRAKQRQLARALSTYCDHGFVFPRENGEMKRPSTVTNAFAGLCGALKIEGGHFHCLRHTFATEMLRAGVPVKVVSEMLGHASVATTLRIYAHVLPDMQDAAAVSAGSLLDRVTALGA